MLSSNAKLSLMSYERDMKLETKSKTFYAWLKTQNFRNDPVGDFAKDAIADSSFPKKTNSFETLRKYLRKRNACLGAFEAQQRAWTEFQLHQKDYPFIARCCLP